MSEPFMPDRVVRRLLDGLPGECFGHVGCKSCIPIHGKLIRGRRLEDGLAAERLLAWLAGLAKQVGAAGQSSQGVPR